MERDRVTDSDPTRLRQHPWNVEAEVMGKRPTDGEESSEKAIEDDALRRRTSDPPASRLAEFRRVSRAWRKAGAEAYFTSAPP